MTLHRFVMALLLLSLLPACRFFKTEASLQIHAVDSQGQPLSGANVLVNKLAIGQTNDLGEFRATVELPAEESVLVEVNKPSTETYFAPFFETILAKRGDLNTFKLKATLYGVAKDAGASAAAAPTAPADPALSESIEAAAQTASESATLGLSEVSSTPSETSEIAAPQMPTEKTKAVTFYVVNGRDALESAAIYYGDPLSRQWKQACLSNSAGRCAAALPEALDRIQVLVRARGFQTQLRNYQLLEGDRVRFEMLRGKSLEVFAINPKQGRMEGVSGVDVSLGGRSLGLTDTYGTLIVRSEDLGSAATSLKLTAKDWLPQEVELPWNPTNQDSVIQHFQSTKPLALRVISGDFVRYLARNAEPMLIAPPTEAVQEALREAGAEILNGPELNGKLNDLQMDLGSLTQGQGLRRLPLAFDYLIRPTAVEGVNARLILSAIDLNGRMVHSVSRSVKAKGSSQAVLAELARELMQNLRVEGTITETSPELTRVNLGQKQGVQAGDRLSIQGNLRLPTGEISAWDQIAEAVVIEAAAERSRVKILDLKPNARIEAGNAAIKIRAGKEGETQSLSLLDSQTSTPIALAEVYAGDRWLGSSDAAGVIKLAQSEILQAPELAVFGPGYAPGIATPDLKELKLTHEPSLIQIESTPEGALVKINGRELGRTPIDTEIPYPGTTVQLEIGGVDGYEYLAKTLNVGSQGIQLRGPRALTLNRDPIQAAKALVSENKPKDAVDVLLTLPETDRNYLLAQHMMGEISLGQLRDPVQAATAFHRVTTHPDAMQYKDKRFIGSYINEAVALYQAGEQFAQADGNLAISYWRQAEAILSKTEEQLRFVPSAQYNQAVHTLSYYRALSLHKTWTLTQNGEDREKALTHWKDYIQGTALALPEDQHHDWVKKAEGYYQQIASARAKPARPGREAATTF